MVSFAPSQFNSSPGNPAGFSLSAKHFCDCGGAERGACVGLRVLRLLPLRRRIPPASLLPKPPGSGSVSRLCH